jgi:hypothetical protein
MLGLAKALWKEARKRPSGGRYFIATPDSNCECTVCSKYHLKVARLTSEKWGMNKPSEPDPFACPNSKHPDGNHSKSWFDGGVCHWCGSS